MKQNIHAAVLLLFCTTLQHLAAQPLHPPPPSIHGDKDKPNQAGEYISQLGQLFYTTGDPATEVWYYTSGLAVNAFALGGSQAAFTFPTEVADHANGVVDIARLNLRVVGEGAHEVDPLADGLYPQMHHFYDKRAGAPINNAKSFSHVVYEEVYDKIDMVLCSNALGPVLYLVCRPGADLSEVLLEIEGHDSLHVDIEGNLEMYKEEKYIELREAMAYQVDSMNNVTDTLEWTGEWQEVNGQNTVKLLYDVYNPEETLVFQVSYPPPVENMPLITDNHIDWATFEGGSAGDDFTTAVALIDDGSMVTGGITFSTDFVPTASVAPNQQYQSGMLYWFEGGFYNYWRLKFGGNIRCIAVDEVNQLIYFGGDNAGPNFYTKDRNENDPLDYYATEAVSGGGSWLACITMTSDEPTLVWSTHFSAQQITAIAIGGHGEVWITGVAGPWFEQTTVGDGGAWMQSAYGWGMGDAFIAKFDDVSQLVWATWIGGAAEEVGLDIAVDDEMNKVVVVGATGSNSYQLGTDCSFPAWVPFPLYDGGGYFQCACGGNNGCGIGDASNGFIAAFDQEGHRKTITYYGGGTGSLASSVAIAANGDVVVAGQQGGNGYHDVPCEEPNASSTGFPHCTSSGWYDVPVSAAWVNHWIARFDDDFNLEWSTFLNEQGTQTALNPLTQPYSTSPWCLPQIDLDETGAITFAGSTYTGSFDHPGVPFDFQPEADNYYETQSSDEDYVFQGTATAMQIYVVKLDANGSPIYGTFFGGYGGSVQEDWYGDTGDLVADVQTRNGRIIVAGASASIFWFPLIINGTYVSAWQWNVPPQSQNFNSNDQYHGFVANLGGALVPNVGVQDDGAQHNGFVAYPVPAQDQLELRVPAGMDMGSLRLFDALGHELPWPGATRNQSDRVILNVAHLSTGAYAISTTGPRPAVARFIKQ